MVTDGAFTDNGDVPQTAVHLSTPPMTGSLTHFQQEGMKPLTRLLLSLPSGVHFRRLGLILLSKEEISLTTALVVECSRTLESLYISHEFPGTSIQYCIHTNNLFLS